MDHLQPFTTDPQLIPNDLQTHPKSIYNHLQSFTIHPQHIHNHLQPTPGSSTIIYNLLPVHSQSFTPPPRFIYNHLQSFTTHSDVWTVHSKFHCDQTIARHYIRFITPLCCHLVTLWINSAFHLLHVFSAMCTYVSWGFHYPPKLYYASEQTESLVFCNL